MVCTKQTFDANALRAFADGRPYDCFGPGWDVTRAHVRTPRITGGRMLFLDQVTALCRYRGIEPAITRELLDAACKSYFVDGLTETTPIVPQRRSSRNRMEVH